MGVFFKRFFATIFGFLVAVILFIGCAIAMVFYASMALAPSERVLKEGTTLVIDLRQNIIDAPEQLNIAQLLSLSSIRNEPTTMLKLIKALDSAQSDPNIVAISILAGGNSPISLANGAELREALIELNINSKKPIYTFAESLSQLEYYIASQSTNITLAPLGAIEWQGVAMNTMFYTPLMNQLGIKAEVFRPTNCTYKSAIEPFTRSSMSTESKEQAERLVNGLWGGIVTDVAEGRGISEQRLKELAFESIIIESKAALENNLIDAIAYIDQYEEALIEAGAVRSKSDNESSKERKGELRTISLNSYANIVENREVEKKSKIDINIDLGFGAEKLGKKIGIIYVDGAITDGASNPTDGNVGATTLIKQLREARNNSDYRAVIVRVNSPGGSALTSDNIWREMELLKERKSLIVSMGAYAASGGYYISAPADLILADRFTMTGSIGVYGIMINAEEALRNKLYINQQSVLSSPSADLGRVTRPITALERAAMMRGVDEIYRAFIDKVAIGRKLSPAIISALAGGRVWSGEDAVDCNLVDEIGGLRSAIKVAINHSGADVNDYSVENIEQAETSQWLEYLTMFNAAIGKSVLSRILSPFSTSYDGDMVRDLRVISAAERGLVMVAPERIEF